MTNFRSRTKIFERTVDFNKQDLNSTIEKNSRKYEQQKNSFKYSGKTPVRARANSNNSIGKSIRLKQKSTTIGVNTQDEICTNIENLDIATYQKQVREIQMLGQFESSKRRQQRFVQKVTQEVPKSEFRPEIKHEIKPEIKARSTSRELSYGKSFTISDSYRVISRSTSWLI